jgi:hypothetical protein
MDMVDCEHRIQFLDDLIRKKDKESQHLSSSYRKLLSDNERMELRLKSDENDLSNLRYYPISSLL